MAAAARAALTVVPSDAAPLDELDGWDVRRVSIDQLIVEDYQRDLVPTLVDDIAKHPDAILFGLLYVSPTRKSGTTFAIIDGQHRWRGAMRRGYGNVHVLVLPYMQYRARAMYFRDFQQQRRNIDAFGKFRAEREAKTKRAMFVHSCMKRHGIEIVRTRQLHPTRLGAIGTAVNVFEYDGTGEILEKAIATVTTVFDVHDERRLAADIIAAVAKFHRRLPNSERDLNETLVHFSTAQVVERGRLLAGPLSRAGESNTDFMADALEEIAGEYSESRRRREEQRRKRAKRQRGK